MDEAHNLPAFSRELPSDRLTPRTVEEAITEAEEFDHEAASAVLEYWRRWRKTFSSVSRMLWGRN